MTMDEIEKLATELERHAQADVRTGRSPEDRHPARIASRAPTPTKSKEDQHHG